MKNLLFGLMALGTISAFAENVEMNLKQGQTAFVNNKEEELILVTCTNLTSANKDKIDIESGSSLSVTLGYQMIAVNNEGNPVTVKVGEKITLNCK